MDKTDVERDIQVISAIEQWNARLLRETVAFLADLSHQTIDDRASQAIDAHIHYIGEEGRKLAKKLNMPYGL